MKLEQLTTIENEYESEMILFFEHNGKKYTLDICLCGDKGIDESFLVSLNERKNDGMYYEQDSMLVSTKEL